MQPFVGAEPEHQVAHRRIGGDALALRHRRHQAGRCQHFETLIDADQKLRRDDLALDGAELHAFGLALDRTQLARRIDFDL